MTAKALKQQHATIGPALHSLPLVHLARAVASLALRADTGRVVGAAAIRVCSKRATGDEQGGDLHAPC